MKDGWLLKPDARAERARLPLTFWVALATTLLACGVKTSVFGFRFSGIAWFVPLVLSVPVVLMSYERVRFPVRLWVPWITVVVGYQLFAAGDNSLQRSIMILSPIATGVAVSTFVRRERDGELLLAACKWAAAVLVGIILVETRVLFTGVLPYTTGLSPEVMTGAVLCGIFSAGYALGRTDYLVFWSVLAAIPVVAVTRMGIVATAISLPLTFAPLRLSRRVLFLAVIAVFGMVIFESERVQNKMFYSGQGTYGDIRFDNPQFATSGRAVFWEIMWEHIKQKPVFGHGSNTSESLLSGYVPGVTHPHNDWLRLAHDYGFFGAGVFALTLLLQTAHLLHRARFVQGAMKVLCTGGASLILVFALFMTSDNIILYAAFFGHLHFALLGMAYTREAEPPPPGAPVPPAGRRGTWYWRKPGAAA